MFISTLSDEIGDETFDIVLPTFFAMHAWELAGGEAFREIAEKLCVCSLDDLFAAWIYPEGYTQGAAGDGGGQTIVIQPGLPFETAQAATDFDLRYPTFIPEGYEFFGASLTGGAEAVLNFVLGEPPQRVMVLVQTIVGAKSGLTLVMDTENARFVDVDGVAATWFFDPVGNEALLDWTTGGVRYRLIGILDPDLALQVAESLE
jgi:hypothetical protein